MRALLAIVATAGLAHAAPATPPAGWTLDPALASPPSTQRFGGATTKVSVYAYRAPTPGAVFYVNRAEAEVAADQRDRLASIELEEPRNAMRRQGAAVKTEQDSQRFDAAKKQLEAIVAWRDPNVAQTDRIVIAGDAKKLVAVTGQCVLASDAAADVAKACEAALATLDTELPPESRVTMSIVSIATTSQPPPTPSPDVLDDGGKMALPPIRVDPPKPEPDRRPIYVGGGLVVLAALFYWNRKRREKFEAEHPFEAPSGGKPSESKGSGDGATADEDADDLHAAAKAGDDEERK